jgi:hypothetical protein
LSHLQQHHRTLVSSASISDTLYPLQQSLGGSMHVGQNVDSGIRIVGLSNPVATPLRHLSTSDPAPPATAIARPVMGAAAATAAWAGTIICTSAAPIILPERRVQRLPAAQAMAPGPIVVAASGGYGVEHNGVASGLGRGGKGKGKTCRVCRNPLKGASDRGEQHVSLDEWNAGKMCTVPTTGRNKQAIMCASCGQPMTRETHTKPCT